ncbi:o-succinylbenzoate synthase [Candidatus Poriferisocius sp.]|uniref:o-succinylbenzoate synthase n=1 Tax=Candidatus Poriferisocius sp. TaxID=3101276 RepID=UPI003B5A16D7
MSRSHLPDVKIRGIELRRVRLPFVAPFVASYETLYERELLVLRVDTEGAHGWGECLALGAPTYSSEFIDGAELVLEHFAIPGLFSRERLTPEQVGVVLADIAGHNTVKSALEMAVLDAALRADGLSLTKFLDVDASPVPCGVTLGRNDDLDELAEIARGHLDAGFARVKLKIMPGFDIEPLRHLRAHLGPDAALEADANGAYHSDDTDCFRAIDELGLVMLEQPFSPDDLLAHARLAEKLETPICLDETITSATAARQAIEVGACSIVNIKPAQVGGYLEAIRTHDVCQRHDVPVWVGGHLETGLGLSANLALARLPNCTLPGDTIPPTRYFTTDIVEPFDVVEGAVEIPPGPGIGIEPNPKMLEVLTTATKYVSNQARKGGRQ